MLSTSWIDLPGAPAAGTPEQALAGVSELAFLEGNYDALVQAEGPLLLRYLVGHALTYTQRGGTVRVEVDEHGSVAHLTIRDRGPAPGPEEIQRIFLPFSLEREMAGRRRASGTITLAASRKIIEIHGGEISATSATDHGVTFRITLPRA